MTSDETRKPRLDPDWTDFNDRFENNLAREESEQYRATRPLRIAKRVFIFCLILFPAAFIGSCQLEEWSYRHDRSPKDADKITLPSTAFIMMITMHPLTLQNMFLAKIIKISDISV